MDTAKRMQAKAHNPGFVGKINNVLLSSPDIGPIKP